MNVLILLIFGVALNVCSALYPNPTYRRVVFEPQEEYSVPAPEYGLPEVRTPAVLYGVPSADSDVVEVKRTNFIQPRLLKIPSTSYGVPFQRVAVPRRTLVTYSVPSVRTFDFEINDNSEEVTQQSALVYQVPKSSNIFRFANSANRKSVDQLPAFRTPSVVYGVPKKPSEEYGVPQVRVPATEYGLF